MTAGTIVLYILSFNQCKSTNIVVFSVYIHCINLKFLYNNINVSSIRHLWVKKAAQHANLTVQFTGMLCENELWQELMYEELVESCRDHSIGTHITHGCCNIGKLVLTIIYNFCNAYGTIQGMENQCLSCHICYS